MTTQQLVESPQDVRRSPWNRLAAGAGAAFVVLTFAGNSLTESVVSADAEPSGETALRALAAQAASGAARLGVAMELAGFLALAVFAVTVTDLVRRRAATGIASGLALVAATIMLAVKLGSGAPYVAGLTHHAALTPDTALALTATNGAAFVLCWLPFGTFVVAAAAALRRAGLVGRVTATLGVLVGALAVLSSVLGVADTTTANPMPFLLACVWTLVVSVRLAWLGGAAEPGVK